MKNLYSRILSYSFISLILLSFNSGRLSAQTAVYNINNPNMLFNMNSNCGNGSRYNGCSGTTGFNFTAALPGGATVTSVVLKLSVGVVCQGGTRYTQFNNVNAPSFNTNTHCNCSGSNNGIFTINLNPANFIANGQNQFRIINPPSCFGLFQYNNALNGNFATVTVNYTTGPPASPTSITASAATICPGGSSTLTANGAAGTVYWFTSGCNTSGQIATGNPISVSPGATTTYYARNFNAGLWSSSCATSTVTVSSAGAPNVTSTTIACGQTATLTASGGGGGTYTWFTNANGTGQVGTGASYTTPALTANATYYVGLLSGGGGGGGNVSTFTAAYAPANWTLSHLNGGNGSVNAGGAPNSIQLTGPNSTNANAYTLYTIAVATSGTISFNWSVAHQDSGYDTFGYRINSTDYPLTTTSASGATSVNVTAGQTFAYYGRTHDGCCGTFTATITNFVGPGAAAAQCLSALATSTVTVTSNVAQPVITGNTSVTCGNTTTLTSSSGNNTAWYSAAANGNLLGTGATYTTPSLTTNTAIYAVQATVAQGSVTFNYTGGLQTWTVPAGVNSISVDIQGAEGSNGYYGYGGKGGRLQAVYPVSSGQVLNIYVGNRTASSAGGYNGGGNGNQYSGGGGGASDIRIGGTALAHRKLVAGGGGGGGYNCGGAGTNNGGGGGGTTGIAGYQCNSQTNYVGLGGTQAAGGANLGGGGQAGSLGIGGNTSYPYGGGGGGGYYGGGAASYGGGGGGSSFAAATATNVVHTQAFKTGNGLCTISWNGVGCSSPVVAVNISVNLPAAPTASNVAVACGATASLTATGGGGNAYQWYSDQAGTAYVGSGSPFVSPALNANTTYYVTSASGQAGGTAYTFTNAGATGKNGPNQGQLNAAYAGTNLNGQVTTTNGIQLWTVPASGAYTIEAFGAQGGGANNYGKGAQIKGTFQLTAGQQIKILVGQSGGFYQSGSGGGGSFVTTSANVPMVIAGGGGGQYNTSSQLYNAHSVVGNNGQATGCTGGGTAGSGGNGCNNSGASGGGGLSGNGGNGSYGTGGQSFLNGGVGGNHSSQAACVGGFGGGGGTHGNTGGGGGGGGYSGGGGGYHNGTNGSGGGGGSYNAGTSPINVGGVRVGHGQVIITVLSSPCVSVTVPVVVTVNAVSTPTVSNQTINCGQTATLTASTNSPTVTWYSNAQGTTTIGSGASFTTPQLSATTTYYVNAGPAGACATGMVGATVTVTAIAAPTASVSPVTCGQTATISASGGGGNTINWYSSANGTGLLGTGASFTTPSLSSNTTYYITSTAGGGNAGAVYTFNNASATGRYGPSQAQVNASYSGTSLANTVTISTQGIQQWTVPTSGNYRIIAKGAQGGGDNNGGKGASMQGDFALTAGQKLFIVVGQRGFGAVNSGACGGGGGSFVATGNATYTTSTALIVAGGGGGASPQQGKPGLITTNGGNGENCQAGGTNGNGGQSAQNCGNGTGGAGGFLTNGQSTGSYGGQHGYGFISGASLGGSSQYGNRVGGFGGGGGTHSNNTGGGPGGGYSGGSAAQHGQNYEGGGGGSFNSGTNPVNTQGVQTGMGSVVITSLATPCASTIVAVPVTVNAIQAPTVTGTTSFCSGAAVTTTLTAAGSPSGYTWWTNANGTGQLGTTASYTTPSINNTTTYYVQSTTPQGGSQTFNYTGAAQTFTAPVSGTYSFDLKGARGGNVTSYYVTNGGLGGRAQGQMTLSAGQVVNVYVGGQGADRLGNHPYGGCTLTNGGWNGGGANRSAGNGTPGGGASDIRIGGNGLNNRVIVAGGGGGCGWSYAAGGAGGGLNGNGGANGTGGGTQNAGGNVGNSGASCSKTAGSLGQGGDGSGSSAGGGGGGGGYYGGGGGGYNQGGGGGSSYYGGAGVTNGSTQTGIQNGNGVVVITWTGAGCVSAVTPVTVTVAAAVAANAGSSILSTVTCGRDTTQIAATALANGFTGVWSVSQGAGATNPGSVSPQGLPNTTLTGSHGGTYHLTWTVTETSSGCTGSDTMMVIFRQPNAASMNNLISVGDVLWNGLSTSDWSTSNNWYVRVSSGGNTYYERMTAGTPGANTEVFTLSSATGGICIGNNMPTLSVTSNAKDVYVNTNMTLNLTNDLINIVGNLTNNGTINASTGTINFTGGQGSTISGNGTTSLYNLTVNKTAPYSLTVNMPVTVTGVLDMTLGNIFTSTNSILSLGNSSAVPGSLSWTSGNIVGPFRRYFINGATTGNAGLFPVGTAAYNRYAKVDFTSTPGLDQNLTVWYKTGAPLTPANIPLYNGLPLTTQDNQLIQNYSADGYWNVDPTGGSYTSSITSAPYTMTLWANNLSGMVTPSITRIIKAPGSNNAQNHHVQWQGAGVHTPIAGGTSPVAFAITSTSMQGFSWFNIGTSNNQALPVELLSFSGTCANEQVDLTWQTASEHNSLSFELEKSRDGEVWSVINTQAAAGNSTQLLTYTYSDKMALEGNNYYRLSQYDIDGASKVYDVINVNCSGSSKGYFSTYPNPTTGAFQVVINNKELVGTSVLNIMDTKGTSILHRAVDVKAGINLFSVQDLQLAPGIYYISITNGDKTTEVIKQSIR